MPVVACVLFAVLAALQPWHTRQVTRRRPRARGSDHSRTSRPVTTKGFIKYDPVRCGSRMRQ